MNDKKTNRQVTKEAKRLKELLAGFNVDEKKIGILAPVIENVAVMKVKLDETKELVQQSSVVIKYDNGGGQTGLRENPVFRGYESLFKSYMQGMEKIIACISDEHAEVKQEELEKPKTVLELVRNKKENDRQSRATAEN